MSVYSYVIKANTTFGDKWSNTLGLVNDLTLTGAYNSLGWVYHFPAADYEIYRDSGAGYKLIYDETSDSVRSHVDNNETETGSAVTPGTPDTDLTLSGAAHIPASGFLARAGKPDRQPFMVVELDLEHCDLTFGTAPCTASGPAGTECYNKFGTCQAQDVFSPSLRTYTFFDSRSDVPQGIIGKRWYPCLTKATLSPTKLEPSSGLGRRAAVTVELVDFQLHDVGEDPYIATRVRKAQGSFLMRWMARNRTNVANRTLRVITGYLPEFDHNERETRTYLVDKIDGPDSQGRIRITAKDPLKQLDDDTALAPKPSRGMLSADVDLSSTSVDLIPAGVGDDYPASGKARCGSEVFGFTRSGDTLTFGARDIFINGDTSHTAGDTVQLCLEYATEQVHNIVNDLITGYTQVNPAYIPYYEWDAEASVYLTRPYGTLITAPTGVRKLVDDLCQQAPFYLWWDERASLLRLHAIKPPAPSTFTLDDVSHIIKNSVQPVEKADLRVSRVLVFFGVKDPAQGLGDATNYRVLLEDIAEDVENTHSYGEPIIRTVYAYWIPASATASALDLCQQVLGRFSVAPRQVTFDVDAKDAGTWTGDVVFVSTRQLADFDGSPARKPLQIIESTDVEPGSRYRYVGLEYYYRQLTIPTDAVTLDITANACNLNIRSLYESIYGTPTGPIDLVVHVHAGVLIASASIYYPALELDGNGSGLYHGGSSPGIYDTGGHPVTSSSRPWPAGTTITLINEGTIQGKGGYGGHGAPAASSLTYPSPWGPDGYYGSFGVYGGEAIRTFTPTTIDNSTGKIYGGGGGGSGCSSERGKAGDGGSGGAGGCGDTGGAGGVGGEGDVWPPAVPAGAHGNPGTGTAGGAAADGSPTSVGPGGYGGDPGEDGGPSTASAFGAAIPGGSAGAAIYGNSYTDIAFVGDIRGPLQN